MKKGIVFLFAVLFVFGGVVSAFAQATANTTQKGSILIYPKIDVTYNHDTFIWLTNDGPAAINVECYWVNGQNYPGNLASGAQQFTDFEISLTDYQEFSFSSAYGGATLTTEAPAFTGMNYQGFLACIAVIDNGQQAVFPAS